ncbi:MAG: TCR/Tet family MFS transporter [Pseudomonadota bacterium]
MRDHRGALGLRSWPGLADSGHAFIDPQTAPSRQHPPATPHYPQRYTMSESADEGSISKRHALTFVTITVLIDVIGFGIVMPVIPAFLMEITGTDLASASRWGGRLLVVYAVLQFLFAPVLGNLSDRFGRRPLLLVSLFMFGVNYLISAFAASLAVLFIGRMLTGIAASTYSVANALVADVSPPEERAQNFGLLGMAFGIGFILGPTIGGFLGEWDTRAPFFVAAALAFVNAAYGFFALKETLPEARRRPFDLRRANPVGALLQIRRYPVLTWVLVALLVYNVSHHVYPSNWNFYTIEKFGWSEIDIGLSMGLVGVLMAIVQGWLIRIVIPRLGEHRTAFVGMSAAVLAYIGIAFAPNSLTVYLWCVVSSLAGLVMPALQGIMSNTVDQSEQGELQGILASLAAVGAIFGPLLMTETFALFTGSNAPVYFPGAAFIVAGALAFVSVTIFAGNVRRLATS